MKFQFKKKSFIYPLHFGHCSSSKDENDCCTLSLLILFLYFYFIININNLLINEYFFTPFILIYLKLT